MRFANLRGEIVLRQCCLDTRDQIAAIGIVIGVLELAPAAFRKVAAGRLLVVRAKGKGAIVQHGIARHSERHMAAARRDSVATRGNPDDRLVHRSASAAGIASARSSAIM